MYILGRGPVFIGDYLGGGVFGAVEEFHAPDFEVNASEAERLTHDNTNGAVAAPDLDILLKLTPKAKIVIDTASATTLAMALGGDVTEVASGASFTDVVFPDDLEVGKTYPIPGGVSNLDTLVIKDSTGSPVTLTANTHYKANLAAGMITILSLASVVQPLKATGTEADAFTVVSIATKANSEKFVRLAGINIAVVPNKPLIVDLYRASFPTSTMVAKSTGNEVATFEFEVTLLADLDAPHDAVFGQFGRVVKG